MRKIILDIEKVHQWFPKDGGTINVLHDINLKVMQGQFVAIVGASGCGKSTLLRAILGTVSSKLGKIYVDEKEVNGPNRDVGIVYQRYSLYDFLTAEQNVAFGLMLDSTSIPYRFFCFPFWWKLRKKHLEEARNLLVDLKLEKALKHYPSELSGGMAQRVAIAQALIMEPKLLLLDEPFGALDEATREQLQHMLLNLYQQNVKAREEGKEAPWTVLMVTHELDEALYVSDRIIGLSKMWVNTSDNALVHGSEVGATKVYDKPSPIFHPDDPRDFNIFFDQKQEIRKIVLDEENEIAVKDIPKYTTFWEDIGGVVFCEGARI